MINLNFLFCFRKLLDTPANISIMDFKSLNLDWWKGFRERATSKNARGLLNDVGQRVTRGTKPVYQVFSASNAGSSPKWVYKVKLGHLEAQSRPSSNQFFAHEEAALNLLTDIIRQVGNDAILKEVKEMIAQNNNTTRNKTFYNRNINVSRFDESSNVKWTCPWCGIADSSDENSRQLLIDHILAEHIQVECFSCVDIGSINTYNDPHKHECANLDSYSDYEDDEIEEMIDELEEAKEAVEKIERQTADWKRRAEEAERDLIEFEKQWKQERRMLLEQLRKAETGQDDVQSMLGFGRGRMFRRVEQNQSAL